MNQAGLVTSRGCRHALEVNRGQIAARRAFYEALPGAFAIPSVKVEIDEKAQDKYARGINLVGRYLGVLLDQLHDWLEGHDQSRQLHRQPAARRALSASAGDAPRAARRALATVRPREALA